MVQQYLHLHIQDQKTLVQLTTKFIKPSIKINDEIVLNPRNYDGAVFEMSSGTDNFYFSTKHIPWWSTNSSILFIYGSIYISW